MARRHFGRYRDEGMEDICIDRVEEGKESKWRMDDWVVYRV